MEGFKYILSHKQRLWVGIANGFTICGMVITMYYESTMTHGFAQHFVARGMDLETAKLEATAYVSMALMLFPIGSALFQAVQGFFSDAWGRKPTAILMSAVSMISFLIFYIGQTGSGIPTWWDFSREPRWGATGHPAILWA